MSIIIRIFTIFLVSSKRINNIERLRPRPAPSSIKKKPTIMTRGAVKASVCPEMYTTNVSGIKPIKKFTSPAKAVEIAKICGGT